MGKLSVSAREMNRAYQSHYMFYEESGQTYINNNGGKVRFSRLLLLFYAVECGLKVIYLKRNSQSSTGDEMNSYKHNINAILKNLRTGEGLLLPQDVQVKTSTEHPPRKINTGEINQAWRYGCDLETGKDIEEQLQKIINWIKIEL